MNKLDKDYQALLQDILDNGVTKQDRTGTGTISVFGRQIRHKMSEGFPLLTTKKMPFKTIVTELLWFLRGETNIKYLVDNNCHIWDGDAYKNYINKEHLSMSFNFLTQEEFVEKIKTDGEFAKKWGELGPVYGKQWRKWEVNEPKEVLRTENVTWPYEPNPHTYQQRVGTFKVRQIDQIQNLINDLKTNPDSRRLMVNAWNVGELDQMVLPPCHYGFQVYTRELNREERVDLYIKKYGDTGMDYEKYKNTIPTRTISLMWNQRSVDTFLGLPFNIASYGLLLEIIAKEVNMVPDQLIGNLGDVHLYSNHIEQAKEQIGRELSLSERREMVTQEMFNQIHNAGGPETLSHSEIDQWNIPRIKTREPFPLPTFDCPALDEIPHTTFDELVLKLQPADFYMDDYISHPTIKAPLSN